MPQALIVAVVGLAVVGIFLAIRGIIRLFLEEEKKLAIFAIIFFVTLPALFLVGIFLPEDVLGAIWIYLPVFLLLVVWICFGYFLEAYLKKEKQRKANGEKRIIPTRPPHCLRNNIFLIAIGIAIWCFGAFVGFGNRGILETCTICISIFLVIRGCAALWKYRGF